MQKYKKRISKEEIEKHAVLILKTYLSFFPDIDTPFVISASSCPNSSYETLIEQEYCTCRGDPHYHYFIDLLPIWDCLGFTLNVGDYLVIRKEDDKFIIEHE